MKSTATLSLPFSLPLRAFGVEIAGAPLVPSLVSGAVIALMTSVIAVSVSALIFGGELSEWVPYGVSLGLLSAVILGGGAALVSSFPGNITIPQDRLAPIVALMAAALADRLRGHASPDEIARTILAAIAIASLLIGIAFHLLGHFGLGNLIRFIPYPVVGGFLAGSGWLLLAGSFRVMAGQTLDVTTLPLLLRPASIAQWAPGLLFGVLLWALLRRRPHFLTVPILVIAATGAFYATAAVFHLPLDRLRDAGWLFQNLPSVPLTQLHILPGLGKVRWDAIAAQGGFFAALLLTAVLSTLLNTTAIEVSSDQEIDLNRELRSTGALNAVGGLFGCLPGFIALGLARLPISLGGSGRLTGLVYAALCGAALLGGSAFLTVIPKFVLGGFLLYMALGFIVEWVVDARKRLPRTDYAVMLLIVVVVGTAGYLPGITVGLVAASTLFLIGYSRVDVVAGRLTGAEQRSNVDRSESEVHILDKKGAQLLILKLQGFLFFGSADRLYGAVRDRVAEPDAPPLRFVLLDFGRVTGIDSSATLSMVKMRRLGEKSGFQLILVRLAPAARRQLAAGDLFSDDTVLLFPDRDHGLEWCEDELLRGTMHTLSFSEEEAPLFRLEKDGASDRARLSRYLESLELAQGEILIRKDDSSGELYFLASGRLRVELELDGGRVARLRSLREGTAVGELGFYLRTPRSTTVRAETRCSLHRLTAAALRRMERDDPGAALLFHHAMNHILADRLAHTNRTLRAVMD